MTTVTKSMTQAKIKELYQKIKPFIKKESQPAYTYYQVKLSDVTITAYTSGKVVFQGQNVEEYADKPKTIKSQIGFPQAGSDEVGTGDYFGPVVVCACIVDQQAKEELQGLGIQDSKQINDATIRKLGPILQEKLPHSVLIVQNSKYNQMHPTCNMVDMKCRLHNQAYVNLQNKGYTLPKDIIIDQFVQKTSYYRYLKNQPDVIQNIHFETKAENKYLSVACASIIARYKFLETMDKMDEHYDFHFEKGAGTKVDQCGKAFVARFGKEKLGQVAKLHFKNTEKILK